MTSNDASAAQAGRAAARDLIGQGLTPPPSFYALLAAAVRRRRLTARDETPASTSTGVSSLA